MQYTTIEQSKRLVELGLDPKTADLHYDGEGEIVGKGRCLALHKPYRDSHIPAWSLDALLKVIPCSYQLTRNARTFRNDTKKNVQFMLLTVLRHDTFDTELEAVYTMVVWLLEKDLLDPIKLKNYDSRRAD